MGIPKLQIRQAVVVEGKYDKIRVEAVVDALILPIDGFRIYKDAERKALLRSLAASRGLVILTDSDAAGFQLRSYLAGGLPAEQVVHVYIPDLYGKERRKRVPSAEGKLGVEGMDPALLRDAFARAGLGAEPTLPPEDPITRGDFYRDGLMGGQDSAERRRALFRMAGLPQRLSTSAALAIINHVLTRAQYSSLLAELGGEVPPAD